MIWPTIQPHRHALRCHLCNQYLPDRCICDGPSIEEIRMANQEKINEALTVPAEALNTGVQHRPNFQQVSRRAGFNPLLAAPYGRNWSHPGAASSNAFDTKAWLRALGRQMALAEQDRKRIASPAGSNAGQFQLYFPDDPRSICTRSVSGNARQRRRQVRDWKLHGFAVKQFNPTTLTNIER